MMTIATVVSITGQAWARDADGNLRELSVGDALQEGEALVTSDGGRAVLDFGDGLEPAVIAGSEEVVMTPDLAPDQATASEEASAQDGDIAALLAAIDEGEGDLLEGLDATAAGGAGGAGGGDSGHGFVRLLRISENVSPLAFNYGANSLEGPNQVEFDPALVAEEDDSPTVDTQDLNGDGDVVWESALSDGSGGGSLTASGAFQIDTGVDALDLIEVQDASGVWIPISANGTNVQGAYGTLTVNTDGSWTYTLDDNTLDHDGVDQTGAADQVQDAFAVRVTDDDGDVSPEATLTIDVNDDGPVAVDDTVTDEVPEDGSVDIDVFANDTAGADGVDLQSGVGVASQPGKGTVTYNGDGTFTYQANPGAEGADSFTYTITDADGDTDTATVNLTIAEDSTPQVVTLGIRAEGNMVWESALPDGSGGGTTTISGTPEIDTGNDQLALIEVKDVNGEWIAIEEDGTEVQGTYGIVTVDTDGSWQYVLSDNTLDHDVSNAVGTNDQVQEQFDVRFTDDDGDVSDPATLTIDVNDDGPVAEDVTADTLTEDGATTTVSGNVFSDGDAAYHADGAGTLQWADAPAGLSDYGTLTTDGDGNWSFTLDNSLAAVQALTADDTLTFDVDYSVTDADQDTAEGQVTVTIQGAADTAQVTVSAQGADSTVDEAGLPAGSDATSDSETDTGSFDVSATDGIASVTVGGTEFSLTDLQGFTAATPSAVIDTGEGELQLTGYSGTATAGTISYTYTLKAAQTHTQPTNDTTLSDTVSVAVAGVGGSADTADLTIAILDDEPVAITPDLGFLVNDVDSDYASFTGQLDLDGVVEDNFGADQGGTVRFTVENGAAANLTSDGAIIYMYVSPDGQTLVGSTYSSGGDAGSDSVLDEKVFTVSLNVDPQGQDSYDVILHQQIDGGAGSFTTVDGDYDFSGGNKQWVSFDSDATQNQDILITPINGSTINTTNSVGGTAGVGNTTIGTNNQGGSQAVRVDYVVNLGGVASSGGSYDVNSPSHTFDGHYTVNGAIATLTEADDTTIRIDIFDYPDSYDGNVVGDSVSGIAKDAVTRVVITYQGVEGYLDLSDWVAGDSGQLELVNSSGVLIDTYTVSFDGESVEVSGLDAGAQIGVSSQDGFSSIEYHYVEGGVFQVGGFGGISFTPGDAVDFGIGLDVTDGDGDSLTIMDAIKLQLAPESHVVQEAENGGDTLTVADGTEGMLLGGDGDDTLSGNEGSDIIYGDDGDDTIMGQGGDNLLYGGAGDDSITGGTGNDIINGGAGDDTLIGGLGADVFAWNLGDEGSSTTPAQDTVTDFTTGIFGTDVNADKLDLSDLLSGMQDGEDLSSYIQASTVGADTILHISTSGALGESDTSAVDQTITLEGVDMNGADSAAFLQSLISNGQLDIE